MIKVIIDTNVIVSSLIQKKHPYFIIYELFFENKFQLCLSKELMSEYCEVLARPKFSNFHEFYFKATALLANIEEKALFYNPKSKLNLIKDLKDNMILELAQKCNANYIVTGNTNDFNFPMFNKTQILNPKDFYENFNTLIKINE